jgi:hypothetical protein
MKDITHILKVFDDFMSLLCANHILEHIFISFMLFSVFNKEEIESLQRSLEI